MLLKNTQQLHLKLIADAVDLVEKNGAAMSRLKTAGTVLDRTRKGTLRMAEQFAFEQTLGKRTAVDANKRSSRSWTQFMQMRGRSTPCQCQFLRSAAPLPMSKPLYA